MAKRLSKGQIAILVMFGAVAVYVGALLLLREPTPWRDIPPEGMSRNGHAWSGEIAELRLYHMPRRGFPFYFEDEQARFEPLARVGDEATIRRILAMLPESGESAGCAPAKRDATLHAITYRADGSVFGYLVLQAGRVTDGAPADATDCVIAWRHKGDGYNSWPLFDLRSRLEEITGSRM